MEDLTSTETNNSLDANTASFSTELSAKFGAENYFYAFGDHVLFATPSNLIKVMTKLKEELGFNMILDVCGVDNSQRPKSEWKHRKRFESVYHLLNMESSERIRVRVPVDTDAGDTVPSVMPLWKGADWFEREAWDMIGINYE